MTTENYLNDETKIKLPLVKTVFDKFLAIILLTFTLPLILLTTAAIILEGLVRRSNRGPVFHTENRITAGSVFKLYKFRIIKSTELQIPVNATPKSIENQPGNLTGVGRILKKFGLDELPQLWNVLKSDMSFVGPRPKPVAEYEAQFSTGLTYRKYFIAGLTGPAQIMKGTNRSEKDEYRADMEYVLKCQTLPGWKILLIDLGILVKTIGTMFKATGE